MPLGNFEEEVYTNGDVEISIRRFSDPFENEYYISVGGVCYITLDDQAWQHLREMFVAYEQEEKELFKPVGNGNNPWKRIWNLVSRILSSGTGSSGPR